MLPRSEWAQLCSIDTPMEQSHNSLCLKNINKFIKKHWHIHYVASISICFQQVLFDPNQFFCQRLEVYKTVPVHFCTDLTSTANATDPHTCRAAPRHGTLLQAVRVVYDSHLLNIHPIVCPLELRYHIGIRSLDDLNQNRIKSVDGFSKLKEIILLTIEEHINTCDIFLFISTHALESHTQYFQLPCLISNHIFNHDKI
ncbi:hypothetical protein RF11_09052 [Thelohanellus kitauei]|uniref:Uncharacterized protein n=1 Tax=Thelohanellus kitauei TaxID=669202 RepID=A0A0C2N9Y8_THEKT|nr:hypothetical protein RF11_09052 [Thelohanellus kitauei]